MEISNARIELLNQIMDAAATRHRVIANNIANVNTPGYKRLEVQFEDELAKVLAAGGDVKTVQPVVVEDAATAERTDGNTVDIDKEMGQLNKNSLLYNAAAQLLANQLSQLRAAITGR